MTDLELKHEIQVLILLNEMLKLKNQEELSSDIEIRKV